MLFEICLKNNAIGYYIIDLEIDYLPVIKAVNLLMNVILTDILFKLIIILM
jgi:hypothetical protein